VFLGRSIPPSGTVTSRSVNHKAMETGSNRYANRSLGVMVSSDTPIFIP
jgi:hypothetical protein